MDERRALKSGTISGWMKAGGSKQDGLDHNGVRLEQCGCGVHAPLFVATSSKSQGVCLAPLEHLFASAFMLIMT